MLLCSEKQAHKCFTVVKVFVWGLVLGLDKTLNVRTDSIQFTNVNLNSTGHVTNRMLN